MLLPFCHFHMLCNLCGLDVEHGCKPLPAILQSIRELKILNVPAHLRGSQNSICVCVLFTTSARIQFAHKGDTRGKGTLSERAGVAPSVQFIQSTPVPEVRASSSHGAAMIERVVFRQTKLGFFGCLHMEVCARGSFLPYVSLC